MELRVAIEAASDPGCLADLAAQHIPLGLNKRQELLELVNSTSRLDRTVQIYAALLGELEQPPLDDFVGRYQLAPGFVVAIKRGEHGLIGESPWDKIEIFPRGEDAFAQRLQSNPEVDGEALPLYLAMARVKPMPTFKFHRGHEGMVVAVSCNDGFTAWPDGHRMGDRESSVPAKQKTADDWGRYTGRYETGADIYANVSVVENQLFIDTLGLQPISDTEFFGETEPMRVWFKLNEAKDVIGMWVGSPQARRQYWKIA